MSVRPFDGAPEAYTYGFNQNGTFDEDERSELAKRPKTAVERDLRVQDLHRP